MDPQEIVRTIHREIKAPATRRAAHGQWVSAAWSVRGLVEQGWDVSNATRQVVARLKLHPAANAFNGVRAAYYVIREKEWPQNSQPTTPEP